MDPVKEQEEKLREAACIGDDDQVRFLLEKGVNINAQHGMNGWSALHWAAKRGHMTIMTRLIQNGASIELKTTKGETAAELASDPNVQKLLGGEVNGNLNKQDLAITPNYLRHPTFPYGGNEQMSSERTSTNMYTSTNGQTNSQQRTGSYHSNSFSRTSPTGGDDELVVKARLAGTGDPDFIEVEIPYSNMTYDNLLNTLSRELNVDKRGVQKVRKLPNTIIRKDKDVRRLVDFQELEIILSTYAVSQHSRNAGGPMPRHIDVVY